MRFSRLSTTAHVVGSTVLSIASTIPLGATLAPTPVDASRAGWITAEVDTTACRLPDPACAGFPPGPALSANANPVRLVLQLQALRPLGDLQREAFDVRTQFAPPDAAPVGVASCPACFEGKPGGTYTLWLIPSAGVWKAGGYYLRVGVTSSPSMTPALVRVEIPEFPPRPPNRPPTAVILATPRNEQATSRPVVFDGSGSSDPDTGDFITMYKWVITSTNPDVDKPNPIVAEGPGVSGVSFPSDLNGAFANIQDLTVALLVTDDPDAPAWFAAGMPVAYRSQETIPYRIVPVGCRDNTPPVAVLAGPPTQQIFGPPGTSVAVLLDGTLSYDAETPIESYTWNCGNGSLPIPQGNGSKAVCKYIVMQSPRTYTATLVVTDRGTGRIVNGQYECAAQSLPASIQIVVAPSTE